MPTFRPSIEFQRKRRASPAMWPSPLFLVFKSISRLVAQQLGAVNQACFPSLERYSQIQATWRLAGVVAPSSFTPSVKNHSSSLLVTCSLELMDSFLRLQYVSRVVLRFRAARVFSSCCTMLSPPYAGIRARTWRPPRRTWQCHRERLSELF